MAVEKIEHVGIMVTDMETSIKFYETVVGLDLLKTLTLDNGVTLGFLGFAEKEEILVELVSGIEVPFPEEGRVHHIAFTVRELETEIARLKELDVAFVNENITTLPDGARYVFFYGPDRERIEFFEPNAK